MKSIAFICFVVVASLVATACDRAPRSAATVTAPVAASAVKTTSFTFTKVPAAFANHAITSPAMGLETIQFRMDATRAAGIAIKEFGFMISGSLQAGNVTNYQLVYYPQGLSKPGVILGTNDGSNWVAPGGDPGSFIRFALASPIVIPKGNSFTAYFGLRADVVGTTTFFFYPRVQTCTVNAGSIDQDVAWFGGDLPLQGDYYDVN